MQRKKFFSRFVFPWITALFLFAATAQAQTKFSLFDQVGAKGVGRTPTKGQLFYTSDVNGTIVPLIIGNADDCLIVGASGTPVWANVCVGALSSVGLSMPAQFTLSNNPLTQNGTIGISWQSTSQNYVLAGPSSGNGVPTFRSLVTGDLYNTIAGSAFGPSGVNHHMGLVPDPGASEGSSRYLREDATWTNPPGSGTVTSVGLSMPTQFGVTGSPVVDSGTLTASWNSQNANKVFAGPTYGGDNAPTFRFLVAADMGMTQKGDIMTRDSTALYRLPVGANGYVLMADSTTTPGIKWAVATGTGTVTSVGLEAPDNPNYGSNPFTISGSPVTAAGTLKFNWHSSCGGYGKFLASGVDLDHGSTPYCRLMVPDDYPVFGASGGGHSRGAVPDPGGTGGSTRYLREDGGWVTPAGGGTVTSVGLGAPSGFSVSGSPVTGSGTLVFSFATTTATRILATDVSGNVGWRTLGTGAGYVGILQPSGTGHAPGLAPDTPGSAGNTKFLREDSSWALPPQGTVTSVGFTAPDEISVSGSPVTGSGSINIGWNVAAANTIFAGPTTGVDDVPAFRALVPADLPVFGASGTNHSKGAVPDPGGTAGTTKYLREDAQWITPTFSSSIEVKEVDGAPDVTGVSILRFDQASGLTVTDNGSGTATVACTDCGGGGGTTAAKQDQFTGDGSTVDFTLTSAPVTNGIIYVSLNGLPQPTSLWSVTGSIVTMDNAPIDGALLAVGYFTTLPGTVTHTQEDFTGAGSTDFTLSHTPATNGVLVVSLRGLIQPQTSWSLVDSTTLRFSAAVPTGDAVTISYNY